MKINLEQIKVKDLDGNETTLDIAKGFANYIYQATGDLAMLETAQEIYKKGSAELDDNARQEILALVKHPSCPFIAVVKKTLIEILEI